MRSSLTSISHDKKRFYHLGFPSLSRLSLNLTNLQLTQVTVKTFVINTHAHPENFVNYPRQPVISRDFHPAWRTVPRVPLQNIVEYCDEAWIWKWIKGCLCTRSGHRRINGVRWYRLVFCPLWALVVRVLSLFKIDTQCLIVRLVWDVVGKSVCVSLDAYCLQWCACQRISFSPPPFLTPANHYEQL